MDGNGAAVARFSLGNQKSCAKCWMTRVDVRMLTETGGQRNRASSLPWLFGPNGPRETPAWTATDGGAKRVAQLPLAHPAFFSPPSPPVLIRFSVSSLAFWDTPTPTAFSNLLMTKWREWREDGPQTSDWWREDIAASWIDLDDHRSSTLLLANDPFTRIALKFQGIYSDDKTRIAPKPSSVHQIFHADSAVRRRLQFWSTHLNCRHLFSGTFCTR